LGESPLPLDSLSLDGIRKMRSHCETNGGFLTLLAAPQQWKQHLKPSELWGYSGNGLTIMDKLKQQFDPDAHLSPGRFLV
ncbi:MAG: FAD-binding oxidoreductase, partial [Okeania sp. SIO2H7]|nr:FAD-binding oxidoreductase [Okeania sp. SIO2H7]